jgi:hypothetical protein
MPCAAASGGVSRRLAQTEGTLNSGRLVRSAEWVVAHLAPISRVFREHNPGQSSRRQSPVSCAARIRGCFAPNHDNLT